MASETEQRLAKLRAELEGWGRRCQIAADAVDDLSGDADKADARGWLVHCREKHAAIARMIDELENGVARLDDYRKR